ncbi:MAG TPA: trypsin-like peptidase domain-containing protein [Nocardioidaceae bacterium]|nr:trypsin-like peptidase domain-containing protein [Nocardioidaceae bacterium]
MPSAAQAGPQRGGRSLGALVLIAALAGGGAGLGGAALYDATMDSNSAAPNSEPLRVDTSSAESPRAQASGLAGTTTEEAASKALPSVVKIYAASDGQSGSGSGIVLTADGEIVTNNHVVEAVASGGQLAVSFNDGTRARATIVGRDPVTDLAVIKAEGVSGLQPAAFGDSDKLSIGQQVIAVGAPFGLDRTVTTGVVSALNRPVNTGSGVGEDLDTVFPAIQTDAAINPGNSGGPLIDIEGNVVGIDSAIRTDSSSSMGQGGSIGLGFAIPINDALPIVEQLRAGEPATHALIGVSVEDAQDELGLPGGARVLAVNSGSAGEDAGLTEGDVVQQVDDVPVSDSNSLIATVRSHRPGDKVTLTIVSSTDTGQVTGEPRTVDITLGSDAS